MIANPVPWPDGARCAASFSFDIDTDSFLHLEFGRSMPDRVASTSWVRYDEIAVPRILDIFRQYGLKQTFFYPAWCMEQYPHLVEAIIEGGHEIAHHGYIHESMNRLPCREAELEWIARGADIIERMTGARPRGFRAPTYHFSRHTASVLTELGFEYDASLMNDDVPCVYTSGDGEIIGLPSHWALDDWPQYVCNSEVGFNVSIRSPQEAMQTFMAEFEFAYNHGGMWIAVWHPWVSGRTGRAEAICSMIESMQARGDVWIASMEEIADHVSGLIDRGEWVPRRVELPYYQQPLDTKGLPPQNG